MTVDLNLIIVPFAKAHAFTTPAKRKTYRRKWCCVLLQLISGLSSRVSTPSDSFFVNVLHRISQLRNITLCKCIYWLYCMYFIVCIQGGSKNLANFLCAL